MRYYLFNIRFSVKSMDCMRPSFEMIEAVDFVLLLVPSEGILTDETDTGILLTLDTDTGRFDVIPDGKLTISDALSLAVPFIGELARSSRSLLAGKGAAKLSS